MVCLSGKDRKTSVADFKANQQGCQKKKRKGDTDAFFSLIFICGLSYQATGLSYECAKRSHGASDTGNQLVKKLPLV